MVAREKNRTVACGSLDAHNVERTGAGATFNGREPVRREPRASRAWTRSGRPTSPPEEWPSPDAPRAGHRRQRTGTSIPWGAVQLASPPGAGQKSRTHTPRTFRSQHASSLADVPVEAVHHELAIDSGPGGQVRGAVAEHVHRDAGIRQPVQGVQDRVSDRLRRRRERLRSWRERGSIRCHRREATTRAPGRQNATAHTSPRVPSDSPRRASPGGAVQVLGRMSSRRGSSHRLSLSRLATSWRRYSGSPRILDARLSASASAAPLPASR